MSSIQFSEIQTTAQHQPQPQYEDTSFLPPLDVILFWRKACSLPIDLLKCMCRWRLASSSQRVAASGTQENSVSLPDADVKDFGRMLREGGYSVFLRKGSLYAFKGLAGRFAPIGVHISMLAIILGTALQRLDRVVFIPCDLGL